MANEQFSLNQLAQKIHAVFVLTKDNKIVLRPNASPSQIKEASELLHQYMDIRFMFNSNTKEKYIEAINPQSENKLNLLAQALYQLEKNELTHNQYHEFQNFLQHHRHQERGMSDSTIVTQNGIKYAALSSMGIDVSVALTMPENMTFQYLKNIENALSPEQQQTYHRALFATKTTCMKFLSPKELVDLYNTIQNELSKNPYHVELNNDLIIVKAEMDQMIQGIANGKVDVNASNIADFYDGLFEVAMARPQNPQSKLALQRLNYFMSKYDQDNHLLNMTPDNVPELSERLQNASELVTKDLSIQPYFKNLQFTDNNGRIIPQNAHNNEWGMLSKIVKNTLIMDMVLGKYHLNEESVSIRANELYETYITSLIAFDLKRRNQKPEYAIHIMNALKNGHVYHIPQSTMAGFTATYVNQYMGVLDRLSHKIGKDADIIQKLYTPIATLDKLGSTRFKEAYPKTNLINAVLNNFSSGAVKGAMAAGTGLLATAFGFAAAPVVAGVMAAYTGINIWKQRAAEIEQHQKLNRPVPTFKQFLSKNISRILLSSASLGSIALGMPVIGLGLGAVAGAQATTDLYRRNKKEGFSSAMSFMRAIPEAFASITGAFLTGSALNTLSDASFSHTKYNTIQFGDKAPIDINSDQFMAHMANQHHEFEPYNITTTNEYTLSLNNNLLSMPLLYVPMDEEKTYYDMKHRLDARPNMSYQREPIEPKDTNRTHTNEPEHSQEQPVTTQPSQEKQEPAQTQPAQGQEQQPAQSQPATYSWTGKGLPDGKIITVTSPAMRIKTPKKAPAPKPVTYSWTGKGLPDGKIITVTSPAMRIKTPKKAPTPKPVTYSLVHDMPNQDIRITINPTTSNSYQYVKPEDRIKPQHLLTDRLPETEQPKIEQPEHKNTTGNSTTYTYQAPQTSIEMPKPEQGTFTLTKQDHETPSVTPFNGTVEKAEPKQDVPGVTPFDGNVEVAEQDHETPSVTPFDGTVEKAEPKQDVPGVTPFDGNVEVAEQDHETPSVTPFDGTVEKAEPKQDVPGVTPFDGNVEVAEQDHETPSVTPFDGTVEINGTDQQNNQPKTDPVILKDAVRQQEFIKIVSEFLKVCGKENPDVMNDMDKLSAYLKQDKWVDNLAKTFTSRKNPELYQWLDDLCTNNGAAALMLKSNFAKYAKVYNADFFARFDTLRRQKNARKRQKYFEQRTQKTVDTKPAMTPAPQQPVPVQEKPQEMIAEQAETTIMPTPQPKQPEPTVQLTTRQQEFIKIVSEFLKVCGKENPDVMDDLDKLSAYLKQDKWVDNLAKTFTSRKNPELYQWLDDLCTNNGAAALMLKSNFAKYAKVYNANFFDRFDTLRRQKNAGKRRNSSEQRTQKTVDTKPAMTPAQQQPTVTENKNPVQPPKTTPVTPLAHTDNEEGVAHRLTSHQQVRLAKIKKLKIREQRHIER